MELLFQSAVLQSERLLSLLEPTNKLMVVELLELNRVDHFIQQQRGVSKVVLDPSNLLPVSDVKRMLSPLATN